MSLQALSYVAQIQGPLREGLRDPVGTFQKFSERISATLGFRPNVGRPLPSGKTSQLTSALSRQDPVTNIDWIGMVVDRSNPNALDWHYINSIQTPSLSIEPRTVFRAGKLQHYAGNVSVDNVNLTLYTDATGKALKFASSWFNCVFDSKSGNYRLPRDYKKDVYVYLFDPERSVVCQLKFFGCFPTSWQSYSLDSGTASPLNTVLDLVLDSFSIGSDEGDINSQLGLLSKSDKDSGGASSNSPFSTAVDKALSFVNL